jgi:hypothetical protein
MRTAPGLSEPLQTTLRRATLEASTWPIEAKRVFCAVLPHDGQSTVTDR